MRLTLGDTFPNFDAEALGAVKFNLYNYLEDNWGLFFSHPSDFTPICTTELSEAAKLNKVFHQKKCRLVGFSCNDLSSHKEWAKDIMALGGLSGEVPFPIVCDHDRHLATELGIMDPKEKDSQGLPLTCRAAFFINPQKKIKAIILYPATVGRSFKEILRVLDALQLTENHPVATPVEWQAGGNCCILPELSERDIKEKFPKGHETRELPSGKAYLKITPDPRG